MSDYEIRRVRHQGKPSYAVFTLDGDRVSGFHLSRDQSEGILQNLVRDEARRRNRRRRACMCCRSVFDSDGIHHRLCDICRCGAPRVTW